MQKSVMADTVLERDGTIALLKEQLARCKADKEFVWSLWKQLQGQSPHLTEAISTAVIREKSKIDKDYRQLLEQLKTSQEEANGLHQMLENKEKDIRHLKQHLQQVDEERNKFSKSWDNERKKVKMQDNQIQQLSQELEKMKALLSEKEAIATDHLQTVESLLMQVREMEDEVKKVNCDKDEILRRNKELERQTMAINGQVEVLQKKISEQALAFIDNHSLTAKLEQRDRQVQKVKQHLSLGEKDKQKLKEELSNMHGVCDAWVSQVALLDATVRELQVEISQLHAEKIMKENHLATTSKQFSELQVHAKELLSENEQLSKQASALKQQLLQQPQQTRDVSTQVSSSDKDHISEVHMHTVGPDCQQQLTIIKEVLEKTERELFELRALQDSKDEQLSATSLAHDRRLERMKTLRRSHSLVLEQLKTYEHTISPQTSNQRQNRQQLKPALHHSRVLKHEDSTAVWNELATYKSKCLELERDLISVEEEKDSLQVLYTQQQSTVIKLKASLQEERSLLEEKILALQKLEKEPSVKVMELEKLNMSLRANNTQLSADYEHLEEKVIQLKRTVAQLQSNIIDLRHQQMVDKFTKSTMTDLATKTDSTTQVDLKITSKPYESSTSSIKLHTTKPCFVADTCKSSVLSTTTTSFSSSSFSPNLSTTAGTSKPSSIEHKRTRSDGEIAVQKRRMKDTLVKLKDFSASVRTGIPGSEAFHTREEKISLCYHHNEMRRKEEKQLCTGLTCVWRHQVKSTQQRLKTLLKQVAVLTKSKHLLTVSLQHERERRLKAEKETNTVQQKLQKSKLTVQELQEKVNAFTASQAELQCKVAALESMGIRVISEQDKRSHYEEELKKVTEEKKVLSEKCSTQVRNLKHAQLQVMEKNKDIEEHLECIARLERDLKQKKQLIADQRQKLCRLEQGTATDKDKIASLEVQVSNLDASLSHSKQRLKCLKQQVEAQTKEKDKVMNMLSNCQVKLEHTLQQLQSCQDECKRRGLQLVAAKQQIAQLLQDSSQKNEVSDTQLTDMKALVTDYRGVIEELAQRLSVLVKERQFQKHRTQSQHHQAMTSSSVSQRARQIAQSAFNLSDAEVDNLLSDDPHPFCQDTNHRVQKVKKLLQAKAPVKRKLLLELSALVDLA